MAEVAKTAKTAPESTVLNKGLSFMGTPFKNQVVNRSKCQGPNGFVIIDGLSVWRVCDLFMTKPAGLKALVKSIFL
jgi:hypothetical protein